MDEKELIKKLREEDESAFEYIFKEYFRRLCLYAYHYLRNQEEAREVVEDFFVDFWDNAENIKINSTIKGYLFKSIRNRCIKYIRHENIKRKIIENNLYIFTDDELLEPASDDFPDAFLISDEIENRISHEIKMLPEQCREVFELSRFGNYTYIEIAEKLNISVNTVKTQMARALSKLRNGLRDILPIIAVILIL
ncbi:MAG TPA: RNA polymerase sigma-70 factor [Bacteroidales bacterium]|nr:RNA polymerase sigma-70 factor [Bacteroidales bacterium]HQG37238.1 RNA polymerase sigma-70 factor [Bacteroidales bacterium]HQG53765.1 RNA polymerase sigma-70 factor [Bacteroidales bacterium]HQJ21500.1 RNA polymerase sigma-70 factor [Bacteroidales bacterium]